MDVKRWIDWRKCPGCGTWMPYTPAVGEDPFMDIAKKLRRERARAYIELLMADLVSETLTREDFDEQALTELFACLRG